MVDGGSDSDGDVCDVLVIYDGGGGGSCSLLLFLLLLMTAVVRELALKTSSHLRMKGVGPRRSAHPFPEPRFFTTSITVICVHRLFPVTTASVLMVGWCVSAPSGSCFCLVVR